MEVIHLNIVASGVFGGEHAARAQVTNLTQNLD